MVASSALAKLLRTLMGLYLAYLLWAAIAKLLWNAEFTAVLHAHGVVPHFVQSSLAWIVPVTELLVAFFASSALSKVPSRFAIALSLAWLIVMSLYLLQVPSDLIFKHGCGCHGSRGSILPRLTKPWAIGINCAWIVVHFIFIAWAGPTEAKPTPKNKMAPQAEP